MLKGLERTWIEEDRLMVYTIKLDDGQELSVNQYEMKDLINEYYRYVEGLNDCFETDDSEY